MCLYSNIRIPSLEEGFEGYENDGETEFWIYRVPEGTAEGRDHEDVHRDEDRHGRADDEKNFHGQLQRDFVF